MEGKTTKKIQATCLPAMEKHANDLDNGDEAEAQEEGKAEHVELQVRPVDPHCGRLAHHLKCQMSNVKCQMSNGKCQKANGNCQISMLSMFNSVGFVSIALDWVPFWWFEIWSTSLQ